MGDNRDHVFVPTDRLDNYDIVKWLLKDQTSDYGRFLRDLGIDELEIIYEDHSSPFFSFIYCGGCSEPGCGIYEEQNSDIHLGYYPSPDSPEDFERGPSRMLYRNIFPKD